MKAETTSFRPHSPRFVSLRRNSVQIGIGFGHANFHAQNLAPAIRIDAEGGDNGKRNNATTAPDL